MVIAPGLGYHRTGFDCKLGSSNEIVILMIAIFNPVLYDCNTLKDTLRFF